MSMALHSVHLPTAPSSSLQFANSNKNGRVFGGQVRGLLSRKSSHLTINSPKKNILPTLENDVIPAIIPQSDVLTRKDFPPDFKFGGSTSALQTEGALNEGGRGPSTWDSRYEDTEERKIACDSYHRYQEDVQLLKDMGADAYRFSISWPRILPKGTLEGGINKEGIEFYNHFIDELLANGIEPYVTLFHFDQPQALEDKYGGFMSNKIVDDFKDYAQVCFENFGDRVKHWTTVNEPQIFAMFGGSVDSFTTCHNMLLSHAAATKLYRENFQATQGGEVGLSLVCQWFEPYSNVPNDKDAAKRYFDFWMGWIMNPLVYGDYPFIMKALAGNALPTFTEEEKEMLKGSTDFLGFNYYTSVFTKGLPINQNEIITSSNALDYSRVESNVTNINGELIGPKAPGGSVYIYPQGLTRALLYTKENYGNPKILITENGYPEVRDDTIPIEKALEDDARIDFISDHLDAIRKANKKGANVKGYFTWSMLDLFESSADEKVRFGVNYVDFNDNLKRYPKKSAKWLRSFNNK